MKGKVLYSLNVMEIMNAANVVFQGFNNRKKYAPYFENWMKGNSN
jgi:hypothetical protein